MPALGSADGWNCRFGRELNATDDRRHFGRRGLPVLEGKLLEPFRVHVANAASMDLAFDRAASAAADARGFDRPRLGYREVAASTNRLTLIAAIVPAGRRHDAHDLLPEASRSTRRAVVSLRRYSTASSRTISCACAAAPMSPRRSSRRCPCPKPARDSAVFARIAALARTLASPDASAGAHAELQARVARSTDCDGAGFSHVLETFPLVARDERNAARAHSTSWNELVRVLISLNR